MLVFDLETDGLLSEVTKVHCLCIYDTENETAYTFDSAKDNIQVGINLLAEADIIVGHNVINYDLPVLDKLYGFKANQYKVLDTLVLSRLIYGDLSETDARLIAKGTWIINCSGPIAIRHGARDYHRPSQNRRVSLICLMLQ